MRLDKFICDSLNISRSDAKKILHKKEISCNGIVTADSSYKVAKNDVISYLGSTLDIVGNIYIMIYKPQDMICSTIDEEYPSVLNILPNIFKNRVHIAGRLDADTTGLVLATNDGAWSHRITTPKKNHIKVYIVDLYRPLTNDEISNLMNGVMLHGEDKLTKPATIDVLDLTRIKLSITEGKYHQVKRMIAAVGNKVIKLHRHAIGNIELDIEINTWRHLTEDEVKKL